MERPLVNSFPINNHSCAKIYLTDIKLFLLILYGSRSISENWLLFSTSKTRTYFLLYEPDLYEATSVLYVIQSSLFGIMTLCIDRTSISHKIAVDRGLQFPLYLLYNIWLTAHSQTALTVWYLSSKVQTSDYSLIFLFPIFFLFSFFFHFYWFLFLPFPFHSANHGRRFYWTSRVECHCRSKPCITVPFWGSNKNDGFPCALKHRQALFHALLKMDHVLPRRFCKETCGRDEVQANRAF